MHVLRKEISAVPAVRRFGRVARRGSLLDDVTGAAGVISLGGQVSLTGGYSRKISREVVGFRDDRAPVIPFENLDGIPLGARADFTDQAVVFSGSVTWLGRVIDGFGNAADGNGPSRQGSGAYPIKANPLPAPSRARVGGKLDLGVRTLNAFATCCMGQRIGIFSGSGAGKSTLLAMFARNTDADAIVIALVGERCREVKEFVEANLGEEGLKRSIVVAATSDDPPLARRQAAYVAMAVAEHLCDQGLHVLLLMDSVTRCAMPQREVGLSAGEPPAAKEHTPAAFEKLPRLLERGGPWFANEQGSITGLFTVLVGGDDHNEPVADAVCGIFYGHIVLERNIAGHRSYPVINILKSVSRAMPDCNMPEEQALMALARAPLAVYDDMAELFRLGAYKSGTKTEVDMAVKLYPQLEAFLSQKKDERTAFSDCYAALEKIMGSAPGKGNGS